MMHAPRRSSHRAFAPLQQRVQTLADISRSALYAFAGYKLIYVYVVNSNETGAPIANSPNSAQLEGTPYHSPQV